MKRPRNLRHVGAWTSLLLALGLLASATPPFATGQAGPRRARRSPPTLGAIYPTGRTQSPITESVAARLRQLSRRGGLHSGVFAKIGASATVSRHFLQCFASDDHVNLADHTELRDTWRFFRERGPIDPFSRHSRATEEGWQAGRALIGSSSPLMRELQSIGPRFAVIMFGTNDIEHGRPDHYARRMNRLVEILTSRGVIPILTTIMPRDDRASADQVVGLYNTVVRGVAQRHQVPLVDYHRELARLPDHGLSRDGVHPNVHFVNGRPRGCNFDSDGLRHGYNIRNLITLEALDRLRRSVLEEGPAPDPHATALRGEGSAARPFEIDNLPFAHASDTAQSPHRDLDRYPACGDHDESGPEVVYRLTLAEPARIHAMVVDGDEVDVDLHVLSGDRCAGRSDSQLEVDLPAGTHRIAVDTFAGSGPAAGEYLLVIARVDRGS